MKKKCEVPSVKLVSLWLLTLLLHGVNLHAQKVPVQFDHYHTQEEVYDYLRDVAVHYPQIAELTEIGQSTMGRPVYVLILTNRTIGEALDRHIVLRNKRKEDVRHMVPQVNHQTKPGQWVCGSTHGNEYTSTEVCLYIIDQLVTGYGSDPEVTDLLDNQTFYVCPVVNPDAHFNSVNLGIPQRQNSLLKDDDGDGRINEDGPEDMNGDGRMSWFRYPDPKGEYVKHANNPDIMVRLGRQVKTDRQRYSVVLEGIDNDQDGRVNEDSEAGFDLNRNFPEGWFTPDGFQGGTGSYPTSAPETKALAEFFVNHPNIHQAQFFHTSGGFTYRPMGSSSDDSMHPEDIAVYDFVLGKRYLEVLGLEVPKAWSYPDSLMVYREELAKSSKNRYAVKRGYEMPEGWVVSWNENSDQRYAFGLQADWAYMQLGIFSLTTELFSYRRDLPGHVFSGETAWSDWQKAAIRYQKEVFDGAFFLEWKPWKHEEFGAGEVGGWITLYGSNNPFPGEMLTTICEKHWQFEKFRATLMPRVEVTSVQAKVLDQQGRDRIVEVTASFTNTGKLATHLGAGQKLPLNRQDVAWLIADPEQTEFLQGRPWQRLGFLGGTMEVPQVRKNKNTAEAKWLIRVQGDPELKVVISSQRGGNAFKLLEIN